ncbi:MAG: PLP-dependent transferase [Burkholderiaceae bacterium]
MTDSKTTGLIHHPYQPPAGFDAPQPGVFKASTVIFANVAAMRARNWREKVGYTYGLHGTPTTFTLEERIASLEGGTHCVLVPSGLAAITLVNAALLQSGDEVLIPDNAYNPGKELARHELARWGVKHRFYDPMRPELLAAMLTPATKLVWIEPPGSLTMEFPDVHALVRAARSVGAIVALDNTWGSGLAFNPFELGEGLGADVSIHALTKYPSGGGDILMGSATTRDPALHLKLNGAHMRMGWGVSANDAETVLRSLPSLALRYAAHDRAARTLANWWAQRPEVKQVLHPALPGSPGHEHWARMCTQAAGLFSVVFDERHSLAQIDAFVDALQFFKIGFSWAGAVSLAVPYDLGLLRPGSAWRGALVRFSVGLEAVEDLIEDSEQALAALAR